jgi:hypothetical protein
MGELSLDQNQLIHALPEVTTVSFRKLSLKGFEIANQPSTGQLPRPRAVVGVHHAFHAVQDVGMLT